MGIAAKNVTKEVFLPAVSCRTAGWLIRHNVTDVPPTLAGLFRMEQGKEVHQRARILFPEGISAQALSTEAAASKTAKLMADASVATIFEATFHIDGYTARADIIRRVKGGWHLVEIKSNVAENDDLIGDLSYTAMVAARCDIPIVKASLLLVSKDYRLCMADDKVFSEIDQTTEVCEKVKEFMSEWEDVAIKTIQPDRPKPTLMFACRACPFFETDCIGKGIKDHIFDLPRLNQKRFDELLAEEAITIHEIPKSYELTENQERVRKSVVSGKPLVGGTLEGDLASIIWPAYYFDFETVMTALPLYPDTAPYTQIPTQFSVHVCSGVGKVTTHHEYLADPSKDCRRELAEKLIAVLGTTGSVIVYHAAFEKTRINELAERFPELSKRLNAINDRILDLKTFITRGYYHPQFHGSYSIKVTLPVMVPTMKYEGLEIGDGDTAVAMFARMAKGQVGQKEAERIRKALLTYCKQDTLAMVKLHEQLMKVSAW